MDGEPCLQPELIGSPVIQSWSPQELSPPWLKVKGLCHLYLCVTPLDPESNFYCENMLVISSVGLSDHISKFPGGSGTQSSSTDKPSSASEDRVSYKHGFPGENLAPSGGTGSKLHAFQSYFLISAWQS